MKPKVQAFLAIIFIGTAVFVSAHFLALFGQAFFNIPLRSNWYPAIVDSVPDLSRMKYLFERGYFAGARMNLSQPFGGSEMFFARKIRPETIEFGCVGNNKSGIGIEFDRDEQGFLGMFLSMTPDRHSFWFRADADGRLLESQKISPVFLPESQTRLRLRIEFRKTRADLYCRNFKICQVPVTAEKKAQIGLFSFYGTETVIDNLRILDAETGQWFEDNFRNDKRYLQFFLCFCGLFFVLCLAALFPLKADSVKKTLFVLCLVWAVAAAVCAALNFYYAEHLKKQIIQNPVLGVKTSLTAVLGTDKASLLGPVGRMAARRWFAFVHEREVRTRDFEKDIEEKDDLKIQKPNRQIKIIFVGTGGEWTTKFRDDYFVVKTEERLQEIFGDRVWIECSGLDNLARDGAGKLFKQYEKFIAGSGLVDICVLNLGVDDVLCSVPDFGAGRFRVELEKFLNFNRQKGILTVLCKEAFCPELKIKGQEHLFAQMDKLEAKAKIPLLSLAEFLTGFDKNNLIWWDARRLRPAGRALAGEFFARELTPVMEDILSSKS